MGSRWSKTPRMRCPRRAAAVSSARSTAHAAVFSFYANKTITTGEGGMLVTRDAKLAQRAQVMRLHGMSRDAFDRFTATVPSWYYEIVAPGFKYNMTDVAAAIGLHQLKKARPICRAARDDRRPLQCRVRIAACADGTLPAVG